MHDIIVAATRAIRLTIIKKCLFIIAFKIIVMIIYPIDARHPQKVSLPATKNAQKAKKNATGVVITCET
jgi:hypothetical protein